MNIHYIVRLNGTGNFNETDDGTPYKRYDANGINDPVIPADTANSGYTWARRLVTEMNVQAATNPLNGQPAGSSNPPKKFSYALNGVYFHRVTAPEFNIVKKRSQGIYTDSLFSNYGVNKASEINMFITGDYQDSTASAFDVGGVACTIGYQPANPSSYWLKVFNSHRMYEWRQVNNGATPPFLGGATVTQDSYRPIANTMGHEIGHLIGLTHTFEGANSCADAAVPNKGNGWNNQMDYTGGTGLALTPCQLGIVNANLYNPGNPTNSYRNYLATSWCDEVPPRANFTMAACLSPGNVRMDSRATFLADRMTIKVYAYNAATATTRGLLATYTRPVSRGGRWNLAPLYGFGANQSYYVTLTATRSSGQSHTRGQVIRVQPPGTAPCPPVIVVTPIEP